MPNRTMSALLVRADHARLWYPPDEITEDTSSHCTATLVNSAPLRRQGFANPRLYNDEVAVLLITSTSSLQSKVSAC